jgi:hypothetical protein
MENDFFNLYEKQNGLELEVGHNSVSDWCLFITDKASDSRTHAVSVQDCDRKKVFATAYDKLTEYLSENRGGY